MLLGEQAKEGRFSFGRFYRRRALRLLPALFVFVIVYAVYAAAVDLRPDITRSSLASIVLFVTNMRGAFTDVPLGEGLSHMWSLALEEQFYLLFPLLVATLITFHRRTWVTVSLLLAMIAAIAAYRAASYDGLGSVIRLYVGTLSRADSLLVGCLVAYLWVKRKLPSRSPGSVAWIALGAFTTFVLFCSLINPLLYLGGFTLIALLCALILLEVLAPGSRMGRLFDQSMLRVVGKVSFGLYIWHPFVFSAVERWSADLPPTLQLSIALAATVAITSLSWAVIESPALRLKDKLERNRGGDAPLHSRR